MTNGINNSSDERLKKNVIDLDYGLKEIQKLRPVSYEWRQNDDGIKLGLIAQEINQVVPEVVHVPENHEEFLSVNYSELIPVLIKAIQEQQKLIEAQNVEISELGKLSKEVQSLKIQFSTLQANLKTNSQ